VQPIDALAGPAVAGVELLVNATGPRGEGTPLPEPCWPLLGPRCRVYDMDTSVPEPPMVARARALGFEGRGGRGMLLRQGALSFEAWTGRPAPLRIMAEAIGVTESLDCG
jgi:shikimate dehydrogenase